MDILTTSKIKDLTLPELLFDYAALEPNISKDTMTYHHDKHHAGYLKKLQEGLKDTMYIESNLGELFSKVDSLPDNVQKIVKNHGGGYWNHLLFWNMLSPKSTKTPPEDLLALINSSFESFDSFKDVFTTNAGGVFGSGWAWLVVNSENKLNVVTTANQMNPLMKGEGKPILCLDVWEHAYYLDYKNDRASYISNFWNVVNWDFVASLI